MHVHRRSPSFLSLLAVDFRVGGDLEFVDKSSTMIDPWPCHLRGGGGGERNPKYISILKGDLVMLVTNIQIHKNSQASKQQ